MDVVEYRTGALFDEAVLSIMLGNAPCEGGGAIVIPGGETLSGVYEKLAEHKKPDCSAAGLILSDERYCPPDSPLSNRGRILPFLKQAGMDERSLIAPDTSLDLERSTARFASDLAVSMQKEGGVRFALLGVGSDGHTAGIFDKSLFDSTEMAAAVSRPDGLAGITVTPFFLKNVETVVFVLRGQRKKAILQSIINNSAGTVAGRLALMHQDARVWFCLE